MCANERPKQKAGDSTWPFVLHSILDGLPTIARRTPEELHRIAEWVGGDLWQRHSRGALSYGDAVGVMKTARPLALPIQALIFGYRRAALSGGSTADKVLILGGEHASFGEVAEGH